MRSYQQYCSLAKALDLVGDRWTLLIVRELLTQGPCRYSDLRRGLPGIATNLLAARLREMAEAGLIERHDMPPPVGAAVVELTPRGRDLTGAVRELTRWGAPALTAYSPADEFRVHWLAIPARHFLTDHAPDAGGQTVRIGSPPDALDVGLGSGAVTVEIADPRRSPDAVVDGPPSVLVATVTGAMGLAAARRAGLAVTGDAHAVARMLPAGAPAASAG